MSLKTTFCNIEFPNPTVLASGYLGVTGASMARCTQFGAGGVTGKTLFMDERKGHPNPTIINLPGFSVINAVGLSGEGIHAAKHEMEKYRELSNGQPIIGSVGGRNLDELAEVAQIMESYPVDMLELNFSCPNVDGEMGKPIACDPILTAQATRVVRQVVKKPISVKVSPNVPNIALVAKHAEAEGADAITAVNTMGPGMLIDIDMRRPTLYNKVGGVSGYALKPIAVRCVYDIYKAVKIPIIAIGGIINWKDAVEMLMAGGTLLGIGSGIMVHDMKVFKMITEGMERFMEKEGVKDVSELIGMAHNE